MNDSNNVNKIRRSPRSFQNFFQLMQNAASHEAKQSICCLATDYNKTQTKWFFSKHALRH